MLPKILAIVFAFCAVVRVPNSHHPQGGRLRSTVALGWLLRLWSVCVRSLFALNLRGHCHEQETCNTHLR